ncbi:hypothetical protein PEDI_44820 [Persicobacter diffluens]|uniref:Uncharacterized protein n=1 Tax=Persicobacter diffluens TaxID=981 RepID=A0AAN4W3L8_9BACT|nr:hypothetical protein PEDI_44820 [Persicobacter diffluens]
MLNTIFYALFTDLFWFSLRGFYLSEKTKSSKIRGLILFENVYNGLKGTDNSHD